MFKSQNLLQVTWSRKAKVVKSNDKNGTTQLSKAMHNGDRRCGWTLAGVF